MKCWRPPSRLYMGLGKKGNLPVPQQRRRCDARTPSSEGRLHRADRCGHLAQYLRRSGHRCRNWPVRGKKRCRFHGGYSTGPTTPEGLARTVAALQAGRTRWLRRLRDEGSPIPFGRKRGGRNRPLEEREQIALRETDAGGKLGSCPESFKLNKKARGASHCEESRRRFNQPIKTR